MSFYLDNHVNKYSPAVELGEFLIVSQTAWSDVDANGEYHNPERYLNPVFDEPYITRIQEVTLDGWIEAGIVWGEREKLTIMIKPAERKETEKETI